MLSYLATLNTHYEEDRTARPEREKEEYIIEFEPTKSMKNPFNKSNSLEQENPIESEAPQNVENTQPTPENESSLPKEEKITSVSSSS